MLQFSTTSYSAIYRNFKTIEHEPFAQQAVIRYYEMHETKILNLDVDEYFEILVAYNEALFDVGAHMKHIKTSDIVIQCSIAENIKDFGGVDIFEHTLFNKAQSHVSQYQYHEAIHIFKALIRMKPNTYEYSKGLYSCYVKQQPKYLLRCKAVFITLNLLIALVIAIKLLVVDIFYETYQAQADLLRNGLIVIAVGILCGGNFVHHLQSKLKVSFFCKK
jgi:tetratricopeptide (TPR) repeat protein